MDALANYQPTIILSAMYKTDNVYRLKKELTLDYDVEISGENQTEGPRIVITRDDCVGGLKQRMVQVSVPVTNVSCTNQDANGVEGSNVTSFNNTGGIFGAANGTLANGTWATNETWVTDGTSPTVNVCNTTIDNTTQRVPQNITQQDHCYIVWTLPCVDNPAMNHTCEVKEGQKQPTRVTLKNLEVSGGWSDYGGGGGIFNNVILTIEDSDIRNNIAPYGGGIGNRGHLILKNTTVRGNTAVQGGGVYNFGRSDSGYIYAIDGWLQRDVLNSDVIDDDDDTSTRRRRLNLAPPTPPTPIIDYGLSDYILNSEGNITLIDSHIYNNTAMVYSVKLTEGNHTDTVTNHLHDNSGVDDKSINNTRGGGIFNLGIATFINSTIYNNQVIGADGTIDDSGGSSYWSATTTTIVLPLQLGRYVPFAFKCAGTTVHR